MKVLTYNIHLWQDPAGQPNFQQIADILQDSQADIIALNEVVHPYSLSGDPQPALTALAQRLHMHFVFAPASGSHLAFAPVAPVTGNALLARRPILAAAAHHLRTQASTRGLLEARILLPDNTPLTCYVTHLDPHDEAVRLAQAKALLTWTLRDRNRPHLLVGDLNTYNPIDYPDAGALKQQLAVDDWTYYEAQTLPYLLKNGYIDACAAVGTGPAATYPAPQARYRIDYILLSQPLAPRLQTCRRLDVPPASDHYPLLAEFSL